MKVFIVFCGVLTLFCVVSCVKHDKTRYKPQTKGDELTTDERWLLKSKKAAPDGQCSIVCNGKPPPAGKNVTKYPDGSWSYDIQLDHNYRINVAYNLTSDFLSIFNPKLNLTWMTDGQLIGIFNITSNAFMLIDTTRNVVKLFTDISFGLMQSQIDIMAFFTSQFSVLLKSSVDLGTDLTFKVDAFLKSLKDRTLETFFEGNLNMFNAFRLNFGFYMNASVHFDGYKTFLQPMLSINKFGLQIATQIDNSIDYGTKLTMGSVNFIFIGIGTITIELASYLQTTITTSINTMWNFGQGSIEAIFKLPGSLMDVFNGMLQISGGGSFHISTGKNKHNGFLIGYGNETIGNFSVNYNNSYNTLGLYNEKLNVIIMADGSTGMYMILNLTSTAGLIVNSTGSAKVVLLNPDNDSTSNDINTSFAVVAKLLKDNEQFNESDALFFNFSAFLTAYFKGDDYFTLGDKNITLSEVTDGNFGQLFSIAINNYGELFSKVGVSVMFNVIYENNVIGLNFAQLMNVIYTENNGRFNEKLMNKVYANVQSNIKAGKNGFAKFIFNGIVKACAGGAFNFNGIGGSFGFHNKC